MPKKGGKGKKKKEDEWGSIPRETFTTVAVRNSQWHHMQFDLVLPTSTRFGAVVEEIVARHELGGAAECKFMLGAPSGDADADANATLPPSAFDMSLSQLQFPAGSKNDGIKAIVSPDRLAAVGLAVWDSDGFGPDGARFDRRGRATIAFARGTVGEPFVAVHTHMSLFRGTPGRSHGKFGGETRSKTAADR